MKFLKSAWGVISKYGTSGVNWVKNNIGLIVDIISGIDCVSQFVEWITEQLRNYFGW